MRYKRKTKVPIPAEVLELFRKSGARGGRQRVKNQSPKQRSESARKAAEARWAKTKAEVTA